MVSRYVGRDEWCYTETEFASWSFKAWVPAVSRGQCRLKGIGGSRSAQDTTDRWQYICASWTTQAMANGVDDSCLTKVRMMLYSMGVKHCSKSRRRADLQAVKQGPASELCQQCISTSFALSLLLHFSVHRQSSLRHRSASTRPRLPWKFAFTHLDCRPRMEVLCKSRARPERTAMRPEALE